MPDLQHTGIIEGDKATALLLNPTTAYVIRVVCKSCGDVGFWTAPRLWSNDLDASAIFRSYEAGVGALSKAREEMSPRSCLADGSFDVCNLDGLVR